MNINELDSFDLADAVKFNDELNPRIWQGSHMRPDVRRKLLAIAKDFKQSLGLSDLEVKDITVSGSNAGYTYTPHSDIDLHLVVDIPQADTSEVYRELFNAKKYQYNDEHNLAIGGYPVELYVENANEPPVSQGMFSVLNNDWINIPRKRKSTTSDNAVKSKYELMKHRIDSAIDSGDLTRLTKTAARIKQMRQAGLAKNGELGPENLAYKILRTQGLIEKLYAARTAAKDKQLSLQERKKKKSRVRYGFGGYWEPGFSFGGEASEGGGGGGGGESVHEDDTGMAQGSMDGDAGAQSTWDGVSASTQEFLNETDNDSEQTVRDFIEHAADRLGIERIPEIKLHTDLEWSEREHSFGRYTPETHTLEVSLANRHVMDILRTVAHELVHCRQHELSPLPDEAGATGSRWENEAHAKAGVLMRDYADANPNRFGEHALSEASGYIPTRAQAKDKRFSTALTVDVHPGQTGKEANKMALQTDAQGRPALLMKEFANQLHEEFEQFDEAAALFEIKMTGKNLRAEAAKTGAIAGMEFEMIVPNVEGDDDDLDPEPDWDMDESVNSISDACDFFENDMSNSPGDIRRLRERMQEDYWEWLGEQFDSRWESDEFELVYNYLVENASDDEIAEILGIEPNEAGEYPEANKQSRVDATDKVIQEGYGNYWYDQARESAQEDFNQSADSESEWLSDRDINSMRDVMDNYGNVDWPYYYTPSSGGDRSIEDVANDFQDAVGRDVQASGAYHSGRVERPSPKSQHYVVEPDGSLEGDNYGDKGLEFVSPPLPIDALLTDLNKVKRWADSYGCYTNDSTGLHINISVPDYSREKLDFVKLAILMGDEYVSDSFGRLGAFYAKSAMGLIRDNVMKDPAAVATTLEKMRTHMTTLASKSIHSGVTHKYTSINVKDGHIEFRSPGGDWLDENFDLIENTLLRFTVALSAATNPEMYRQEYLKKLYKILTPEGQKDEYGDMLQEFAKYMASLQGSSEESAGALSKETQRAIKDFRSVAAKELKQSNLTKKLKKNKSVNQRYWWSVSNPPQSLASIQVVANSEQEAIEKAIGPDGYPSWANTKQSIVAKPLRPYEEEKPYIGSQTDMENRLGWPDQTGDANWEIVDRARNRPVFVFIANTMSDAARKYNDWLGAAGLPDDTEDYGFREIGQNALNQRYEIYNRQTGNSVENAPARVTNDAEAIAHLEDYFEHGPHGLQPTQAARMFSIRAVHRQAPAGGRAATSSTGQWKIVDGLNREVYRFRPAENTRAKANELAALWARENNFDGNYQVEPADETTDNWSQDFERRMQSGTPDQQQGGLIDVAGSTNDLARQRSTPGTFTGAWRVLDADGNELYRFSGIGNNQSDANRVAVQWMRSNGYDHGTEMSVVPIMSESIAEGMPPPSQGPGKYRDLNKPLGPETPPQMPAGTTKIDVSDTQDWYQMGMDISNIGAAKPEEYNQGPPHTVIVFPSDEFEQPYLKQFKRLGLKTHDIDPPGQEDIDESAEFYSMPLRMSEYRGKTHPATNEPYDSKFKFSGDLKDRVHRMLDAGTKPKVIQVNPRHLLATQDWLSSQGGGKPAFATMKQHPVVLQKNNKMYILDGHHRSADALKSGSPIQVYLFKDEL